MCRVIAIIAVRGDSIATNSISLGPDKKILFQSYFASAMRDTEAYSRLTKLATDFKLAETFLRIGIGRGVASSGRDYSSMVGEIFSYFAVRKTDFVFRKPEEEVKSGFADKIPILLLYCAVTVFGLPHLLGISRRANFWASEAIFFVLLKEGVREEFVRINSLVTLYWNKIFDSYLYELLIR